MGEDGRGFVLTLLVPLPHYPPYRIPFQVLLSPHPIGLFSAGKMSSVIRLFSLVLALALAGVSVNAYAIPRASVDYRRHDVNVRIVEETASIPSVASSPRFIGRRRGVRDFRFPTPLRTRQALHRPELDDLPDFMPDIPMEGQGSVHTHAVPRSSRNQIAPRDLALPYTDAIPTVLPRNAAGLVQLDLLNTYYQQMIVHSRNLREDSLFVHSLYLAHGFSQGDYSGRARDSRNDPRFRDDAVRELSGFRDDMGRTQGLLGDLGRDKGLANYDRNNDLETLLKDIVNLNKDTLSSVTDIVYEIPLLGPTLGPSKWVVILHVFSLAHPPGSPVVGELKCIVDDVLNTVENTVDGLLNTLGITGKWRNLRGDYANALCGGNLEILGLCVDTNLAGLGLRSD
jgi:hypothetical protein